MDPFWGVPLFLETHKTESHWVFSKWFNDLITWNSFILSVFFSSLLRINVLPVWTYQFPTTQQPNNPTTKRCSQQSWPKYPLSSSEASLVKAPSLAHLRQWFSSGILPLLPIGAESEPSLSAVRAISSKSSGATKSLHTAYLQESIQDADSRVGFHIIIVLFHVSFCYRFLSGNSPIDYFALVTLWQSSRFSWCVHVKQVNSGISKFSKSTR